MDQSLQPLLAGKHIAGDDTISPASNSVDLTQIYHDYFLSALQLPYIPSYYFPNINLDNKNINIGLGDYCSLTNQTFKKPKPEPETTSFHLTPTVLFSQLPGLDIHSLEHVTNPSLTNYFALTDPTPVQKPKQTQKPNRIRDNEKRRMWRKKISEKTWSLQKLLPSSYKKMDMASVYEEASKYIKYLKAQIKVLEAMSVVGDDGFGVTGSCSGSNFGRENGNDSGGDDDDGYGYGYGGELEKLNRSELLEVLVNSDVAQGMMYSRGFCVYSIEQKLLLKELDDNHLLSTDPSFYY